MPRKAIRCLEAGCGTNVRSWSQCPILRSYLGTFLVKRLRVLLSERPH